MWGLLVVLLLTGVWLFAVAPGRSAQSQRAPFEGRTFAHRGLYRQDQTVPENTLSAFLAAVTAGYGIELDVQLSRDGQLVVFHDDTLDRACGVHARVDALTYEELRALSLFQTDHRIPLFCDVWKLIDGRVPLIVEIKAGGDWRRVCEETRKQLTLYRGSYCVESFHPRVVQWYRHNAPTVLRGQLSEAYRYSHQWVPWYTALMMSRLLTNMFTRPQFIAYRIGKRCLSVRVSEWLGAMRVRWTAHPEHDWLALVRSSDGIIFEYMRPPVRFTHTHTDAAVPVVERLAGKEQASPALHDASGAHACSD